MPSHLISDIAGILRSGQTSPFFKNPKGGPYVQRFEKAFAKYVGRRYAVSVANGTLALNAAYTMIRHVKPPNKTLGREVITTPYTFLATASEILRAGLFPIFADVEPFTFALSPETVREKISYNTRAIVIMHPLGVPCHMNRFTQMAKERGVFLIEDAAQALGSTFNGQMCGSFGDLACFSFQQTKSLSTGEGGMIVTNGSGAWEVLCALRNHGNLYGPFQEKFPGLVSTNYRLTEIQAAMGLNAIGNYGDTLKTQREKAKVLLEGIQKSHLLESQVGDEQANPNAYIIGARVLHAPSPSARSRARRRLLRRLAKFNKSRSGAIISQGYTKLAYHHPILERDASTCPVAEQLLNDAVWFDIRRMPLARVHALAKETRKFT